METNGAGAQAKCDSPNNSSVVDVCLDAGAQAKCDSLNKTQL